MANTGYLNTNPDQYPLYRNKIIKKLSDIQDSGIKDEVKSYILLLKDKYSVQDPSCKIICENFCVYDKGKHKVQIDYGFYKVQPENAWMQHVWVEIDGIKIDLRSCYELYFNQNTKSYTDLKLAFTLPYIPGNYKFDIRKYGSYSDSNYLEKNKNRVVYATKRNIPNTLYSVKQNLFDAPDNIKHSWNNIIRYFYYE